MRNFLRDQGGISLIEMLLTLTITALMVTAIVSAFYSFTRLWNSGMGDLSWGGNARTNMEILSSRLKFAQSIQDVSLMTNTDGYIQYIDDHGRTISIFRNTSDNQARFGENTQSSSNIVITVGGTTEFDTLINNVSGFTITTYETDVNYIRIASPNNQTDPVSTSNISSLKIDLVVGNNSSVATQTILIGLSRSLLSTSGTMSYGTTYDGSTQFPFGTMDGYAGFALDNMSVTTNFDLEPDGTDGLELAVSTATVKIANTGRYFSTIGDAISAAVSGDEIWVSEGTYSEPIIMKSGITLLGGFNRMNWDRDILNYSTVIATLPGVSETAVQMATDSTVDGFTLDANNLKYGVVAAQVSRFQLSHCAIINAESGIYIADASGKIWNNSVTANTSCLTISNANGLKIYRNRLMSLNRGEDSNIQVKGTTNFDLTNNLILGGNPGIYCTGVIANFANNIITDVAGVVLIANSACNVVIANNCIMNNDFGIYAPYGSVTIVYNYFSNNTFGTYANDSGPATIGAGNIESGSAGFAETETYTLNSDSGLIDSGDPNYAYYDSYTGGFPCRGQDQNDIGLYGGPLAGRIGQGNVIRVATGNDIVALINDAISGDMVSVGAGTFTIASALVPRASIDISGFGPTLTQIIRSGGTIIQPDAGCTIRNVMVDGGTIGVAVSSKTGIQISNCILRNTGTGIAIASSPQTRIVSVVATQNGTSISVVGGGSDVSIENSIIAQSTVGVSVSAGNVTAKSCDFFQNTAHFSGVVSQSNILFVDPQFWDISADSYLLKSSSPLINANAQNPDKDLGCFEYFIATGSALSDLMTTKFPRHYKSLSINLFGTSMPTADASPSQIDIFYILNGTTVTVSSMLVTNNLPIAMNLDLGPRVIGTTFQVKVSMGSYRFMRTPYIADIGLVF